jgi:hypothetical protein
MESGDRDLLKEDLNLCTVSSRKTTIRHWTYPTAA